MEKPKQGFLETWEISKLFQANLFHIHYNIAILLQNWSCLHNIKYIF